MVASTLVFMSISAILLSFLSSMVLAADSLRPPESIKDGGTLVSSDGSFELGFFSPGISKNRYLGIWYKNIPVQTVVWVANRCNPIIDMSGLLTLNSSGNLVLLGHNKTVVWSSSSSSSKQAQKPILQLLDTGNLVVGDEKDNGVVMYSWQSFDYPSDTGLPGMKTGFNLKTGFKWVLSAWRNPDDPCPDNYTFSLESHTNPELYITDGKTKMYRSGPWNGIRFSGVPELTTNQLFDFQFVYNEDEAYYMYNLRNKSVVSRIVLNETTGTRQRLTWIEADQTWRLYSATPRDYCDDYGICGANGNCIITENPPCQCLQGFKPKYQEKWNSMDWSDGCVRDDPLHCGEKHKDGFVKFSGLKLPEATNSSVDKSMSLKECGAKCLSNCSCMAYTNSDIRGEGSGCVMWFGDLLDIRQVPNGGEYLHIRMPASQLAKSVHKKRAVMIIVAIVVGAVSGIFLASFYIFRRTFFKENKTATNILNRKKGGREEDLELPLFDLSMITIATSNFSESKKLGEGGFGPVYRGKLEDGQEIAVKRLSVSSGQGVTEFKNEIILIAKLQHRNLVKLLGCCIQGEEKLLVYEYLPNKSLDSFIFDQTLGKLLKWPKRFEIICGIARGILYLHQDSRLRIIHRDLKASNILLDNEMNPKISDFGMAKTFAGDQTEGNTNRVVGTYGYMAPEYAFNGLFSIKSDVFSFGIMVLEIVSGKRSRAFFPSQKDGLTLAGYAWTLMMDDRATELLDGCLRESLYHNVQQVLHCIHIGLLCVQQRPLDRPSMSSVVLMLSSDNTELPRPKKPGYFIESDQPIERSPESSPTNEITMSVLEAR